jgi:hypothetical protein
MRNNACLLFSLQLIIAPFYGDTWVQLFLGKTCNVLFQVKSRIALSPGIRTDVYGNVAGALPNRSLRVEGESFVRPSHSRPNQLAVKAL